MVLPDCINTTSGFLPDVMQVVSLSSVPTEASGSFELDVSSVDPPMLVGDHLKLRTLDVPCQTLIGEVASVDAASAMATVTLLGSAQVSAGTTSLFAVGRKVSDMKTVNFEQIGAVMIGAMQAQAMRLSSVEARLDAISA